MDLKLIESGNGGDVVRLGNDLSIINGFQNMPYLAMFGGNPEQNTPTTRKPTEQAFDYWGNSLLFANQPEIQFNSNTERALSNTALNSAGRITIQNAVISDLKFMEKFAKVTVEVSLVNVDRVQIFIRIIKLDNLEATEFIYIWDSTQQELITGDSSQSTTSSLNLMSFDDGEQGQFDDNFFIEFD